ncbi:ribosomal RNA-processing protein 7 homolog A [Polypterus senegalus]|uniref:ribosomal RNA-processing protein 7 homolog A n=1 Tax=Polypterus senegalus TaxID=55291 RepID=UPI0019633819|nr:ribosomal RNA-processing protein 7 homolog A [Polypterus senegalus]
MAAPDVKHAIGLREIPGGFTAIPICFQKTSRSHHYLYVKEHKVRTEVHTTRPLDRTLLVLNVPPYCDEACLKRILSPCGHICSIEMRDKPGPVEKDDSEQSKFFKAPQPQGFSVAYVVFRKASGVAAAKKLHPKKPVVLSTDDHPIKTGIKKWISEYRDSLINTEELQAEVDAFMQEYDKKEAEEKQRAEAEDGVPDEEGWIKVTRHGKRPVMPRTQAASQKILAREKKKRAKKELLNFYAWQHRETKREHIAELRKKFEEDKQRIALMRAQRKFRPY